MRAKIFGWMMVALCAGLVLAGCGKKALNQAQGDAKRTACVSNLKQLGASVKTYTDDHMGFMPAPEDLERGKYVKKGEASDPNGIVCCPETHQQYEFVIPKLTKTNSVKFQNGRSPDKIPMIRCPKHGHLVYLDGSVEEQK